jgi:hypothetical protein
MKQVCSSCCVSAKFLLHQVPIYDARGRPNFMFTAENMAQLGLLPLYTRNGAPADPPSHTLVAVGYAVNEYTYSGVSSLQGMPVVSPNILFVIVIGDVDRSFLDALATRMEEIRNNV